MKQKCNIVTLLALVICCNVANAQYIPTVEEGKEWTIQLSYGLGSYHYSKYTLLCDSLIHGNAYLAIYNDADTIVGFLREDTSLQEVYFVPVNNTVEETILSYKGEAGDTIHLTNGDLVIREVYYANLFGAVRKVIVIDDLFSLIEGAGTSRYGIITNYPLPSPWPSLFDLQQSNTTCETITSTVQWTESFSVYPNPFTDFIHITTPGDLPNYYEIYNSSGIRILSGYSMHEATIDTKSFFPGIYVLVINSKIIKMIKL